MSEAMFRLEPQIRQWVRDGLISTEQADAILAKYPDSPRNGWILAYALIGGVLCVAGVSLLIASNWQSIPALVKLAGVLVLLTGGTITGVEAQRRGGHRGVWECAYLVAAVFPLLALALISQIFHLSGETSGLLAVWFFAVTPLAVMSGSGAAFFAWVAAGYTWLGFRLGETTHFDDMWQFFLIYAFVGVVLAGLSQLWLKIGRTELRAMGEFIGVATAALSLWMVGFDIVHWFALWGGLFLAALGWIWLSMERGRVHQVNVGFVLVGLLIISTFIRLVGTMAQTGVIFLGGGAVLLLTAWGLNRLRREVLERMS
jgi:uncharacterized membrane protein